MIVYIVTLISGLALLLIPGDSEHLPTVGQIFVVSAILSLMQIALDAI